MASIYKRKKGKGKWLISYTDAKGKRRTVTGTESKAVTEQIAAKLENDTALTRRGVIDGRMVKYAGQENRPITEHLDAWYASLLATGATEKHARTVKARAEKIIHLGGIEHISDLAASVVQAAIKRLREGVDQDDQGRSLQTCTHYVRAIKQFSRWLWRDKRAIEDTLAHLATYNAALDRRRERRVLSDEELAHLIHTAERGPVVLGISGPDRAVLYRVAVGTGYRVAELRSLTPESFDLEAAPPTVTVEAGYSKRRKQDVQPVREDLAQRLRPWLADKVSAVPVFKLPEKTAKMLRADLAAAGIPYEDGAGQVFDFHALRGQYITALVRSGASVKVCQELARHSDPRLTLNIYTNLTIADKTAALEGLPDLTTKGADKEALQATGTEDLTASPTGPSTAHAQRADATKGDLLRVHATSEPRASDPQQATKAPENKRKAPVDGTITGLRPAGFEPATCGLEDYRQGTAKGLNHQDLSETATEARSARDSAQPQKRALADLAEQLRQLPAEDRKALLRALAE